MPTRRALSRSLLAAMAIAVVDLAGCAGARHAPPSQVPRFFAPSSFWNQPVPSSAPLDPSSRTMVAALASEIGAEERNHSGPWISTVQYGVPIFTVSRSQPTVRIKLVGGRNTALSQAWRSVPIPASAQPAEGHDGYLVVWQPSTDRMWEFWRLVRIHGSFAATWGGAMQNVSSDKGVYGTGAWPGAEPYWGVTATSFPLVGGAITIPELERGQINHALALSVPNARTGVFAAPAQRTDGSDASLSALPEGARLRLNPNLDLARLKMPRLTRMIAEAAQRYGIIIRDRSSIVSFAGQDPNSSATNPYPALYQGEYPDQLLASFPWKDLQVLRLSLVRAPG